MKTDKTVLKKALKQAHAYQWQQIAAFILLSVNGIENALEYVKTINNAGGFQLKLFR